jgi:hypothetical protein
MNMNTKQRLTILLTAAALSAGVVRADVLISENFSGFDTGNIDGQNGWSVSGNSESQHTIISGGLSFTSGDVVHNGGTQKIRINGTTQQYASTTFTSQGGDIYFSFLFSHVAGNFFMLGLTEGAPTDASNLAGAGVLRDNEPRVGGRIGSNVFSPDTRVDSTNVAFSTGLIVGKLSKSDSEKNYDTFSFLVNPNSLDEPETWTRTITRDTGLENVDTLWFRAGSSGTQTFHVDMIRVGTTFDAVVIPEPGTLALVGIALGSLLLFRRRP